jgi:ferredoxin--NADP+ reductase
MAHSLPQDQIDQLRAQHYNATLISWRLANPELAILRVQPDFPIAAHRAGQYCTLGLGAWEPRLSECQEETLAPGEECKLIRRSYSISHPIEDRPGHLLESGTPWLEFYIVLVRYSESGKPPGLTPRLFTLQEGNRLYVGEKITGHYTLDPVQPHDTVLLLSTGTGEAPHNYMLWELLRQGFDGTILSACCVRYRRDLGYVETHERLMKRYPNYTYWPLTTREADSIHRKVYIQDLITSGELERRLGHPLDPSRTHVFLCGNPKMIGIPTVDRSTGRSTYPQPTGVIELLEQRGFRSDQSSRQRGNIHFEKYW